MTGARSSVIVSTQAGKRGAVVAHMIVCLVHKNIGLPPGKFTRKGAILNYLRRAKRKARKRRLKRKLERGNKSTTAEVREEPTYEPGVEFNDLEVDDVEAIPPPHYPPLESPPVGSVSYVYFDLEATGFERDSHITQFTQIAALDEDSDEYFCTYVIPQKPISTQASKVTGLALNGTTLHHNGKAVKAVPIQEALQDLISFLGNLPSKKPKILVGHTIKSYDCPILMNALRNCNTEDRFEEGVIGFLDTMKLFKLSFPSQKSYSQQHLSQVLLAEGFTYEAHNALESVIRFKGMKNGRRLDRTMFRSGDGFPKELENAPSNAIFIDGLKGVGIKRKPTEKRSKQSTKRLSMPTVGVIEGPNETEVSQETQFVEEKYDGQYEIDINKLLLAPSEYSSREVDQGWVDEIKHAILTAPGGPVTVFPVLFDPS
ncbi:uncharacterized protein LOC134260699, partial [Saccostrea cucullata]|uniref:uncharacterized protein LOC134260699 n=1 Tax=Saccostrea cuccullata TaxID=36930 RepID=UPI002ED1E356